MVRSARLLGVSVAAALIASVLFIGPASAGNRGDDTITVPKGGDIQGAVNRAEPGETIIVGPGSYEGPVFITTNRISIIGAGANETWIVPPSGGNGEAGFYVGDSPNSQAQVWNNTAYDSQFGFFFRDSSFGDAENNTAWGNCAGFVALNTGAPGPMKRWLIENNVSHDNSKA